MSAAAAARRLARFVRGLSLESIPTSVVDRATLLTLDTLGSCLASATMDFGRAVSATAAGLGGAAESAIVGTPTRVAAPNAVLANGTLAHGLDFDDTREDAIVHTGCVAVTTALAVAEAIHAPGPAALEALIAGVEVMCRIGLAVPGKFHARSFHPTSLTATFAAAAVAGKLYRLSEDELVHAFGICGSQAGGIIEYLADGSWTKRLHPGWAGHAGIIAARLGREGFTGPETVLEGAHGFYEAFAGGAEPARLDAVLDTLGHTWELANLTFKPYPCGSIAQPYMDCAHVLRERHRLAPESIASVRCRTAAGPVPRLWEPLAAKHRPPNGYAAKFSLPYLIATVLVRGTVTLADFADAAVADPRVLALAAKIEYDLDATIDYPRQFVGDVRVALTDGRMLEERRDHPRGGPDDPMSAAELIEKFRGNAALHLKREKIDEVIAAVSALVTAPDLRTLTRALAP